jgi:hypothetical protein
MLIQEVEMQQLLPEGQWLQKKTVPLLVCLCFYQAQQQLTSCKEDRKQLEPRAACSFSIILSFILS